MSYLVLARKYRPQTFSEVIGQEHVTRTLQNAITRGRIHHAFLFCGGRGTGKTTTARILAKALSCVNAPTPTPCNQCPACIEITSGSSVDVQEIDAASQNSVADIRELREAIRYAPVRGKKKLYILDEVHMLSTSAFNALLKTLEEPPPHALFVFATTDPHKLPQTILSRVQRYDFKLVPTPRLVEHLADVLGKEGIEFDRGALQLVAREGAGSVRDSLSLLDQVLASCEGQLTEEQAAAILGVADRGLILELGRAVLAKDQAGVLRIVDSAYSRGYDLAQLARTFLSHLRDLVVIRVIPEPGNLLDATGAELEELRRQAATAGSSAEMMFDRMVRVAEDTSRAPLQRYVLEVGLLELCRIEPLQPIDELLGRLESLEGQLDGRPGGGMPGGGGIPGGGGSRSREEPRAATRPLGAPAGRPSFGASAATATSPAVASLAPAVAAPAPVVAAPAPVVAAPAPAVAAPAPVVEHPQPVVVDQAPPASHPQPDPPRSQPDPVPAPIVLSWDRLAEAVLHRDPLLSDLALARPQRWDTERLVLAYNNQYMAQRMKDKLPQLRRVLAQELGSDHLTIEIVFDPKLPAHAESLDETQRRKLEEERAARRRDALGHPSRKLLTEVFGSGVSFQEPELE